VTRTETPFWQADSRDSLTADSAMKP